MQIPPDSRRATTSRPLTTSGPLSRPTAAPRSRPLTSGPLTSRPLTTSGPLSHPLGGASSQPLPGALSQPRRLQLSGLIDDRIRSVSARERQRTWLVNTVVLAQALITLMVVPGYLFPSPNLPVLLTLAVALVFYLAAFIFNRMRGELRVAVYMLIGGGTLATAALVFVTAILSSDSAHTAQAALLFLPIILEAGLFLTPELTLLVASAAAVFTASAILLALAFGSDASSQLSEAYLVMVYALGLEAFIGYLAWRLAQFIYDTVKSAQADDDLRFAQARLSAAERQMNEQRRQLIQDIGIIQLGVSSALAHEYETRVEVPEGELAPLAASLNLLIQQLRSTNDLERKVQKMEAQAVPLVQMAGGLMTGAPPVSANETPTDSALYSVRAALSQAQAMNARRQARLQEVAAEISNALKHSREGLANTASDSAQAQQIAGQLVSLVESLSQTAQRQRDLLAKSRRALALVLPPELIQGDPASAALLDPSAAHDSDNSGDLAGLGAALGIMNRYTKEFAVLDPVDHDAAGIPPLTTPLPTLRALNSSEAAEQASAAGDGAPASPASPASPGELPAGLADAWLLLSLLQAQTDEEARAVDGFVFDIGVLSKHVRHTGVGIDWVNQAMDTVERCAEQMQQLASSSGAEMIDDSGVLGMAGLAGMARPGSSSIPRRPPIATRPLEADARLGLDAEGGPATASAPDIAPGSLRVSQLIGPDALLPSGDQTAPTDLGAEGDPEAR